MKKILITLLVIILLVLTACGGEDLGPISERNYKTGYAELDIAVDEQMTPDTIHQNTVEGFTLSFNLFNRAGYDAKNVKVRLANYDHTYLDFVVNDQTVNTIDKNSIFNNDNTGGREFLTFTGDVLDLRGAEQKRANYRLYLSYDSKVELSPTICVNPRPYQIHDVGCNVPTGTVSFSGQGAPLAVTQMEQIIPGGDSPKMELRFKVENVGKGIIKKITLGKTALGNDPLTCEFKGAVSKGPQTIAFKRDKKSAELVCTRFLQGHASYETPILVELFYDYEFSQKRSVTIK